MARTYTTAKMKFFDTTAVDDAEITVSESSTFSNLNLFKGEQIDRQPYMIPGLNQIVLDGTMPELPESPNDIAWLSKQKSNGKGEFANPPRITIAFDVTHTSNGMTLHFTELPGRIKVTWYSLKNVKIAEAELIPDDLNYYVNKQVKDYGRITIDIPNTRMPYRYAGLQYIDYGIVLTWNDGIIKRAVINESISYTNETLEINTCDIEIIDPEESYNPNNADGIWNSLQKNQAISVVEYVDDKRIPCGTFYIKDWSWSDNIVKFRLYDGIGYIDNFRFVNGKIYKDEPVSNIVDSIMQTAGFKTYCIDAELSAMTLSGYIPICTCREALQLVAFALNAAVNCSRSGCITIAKPKRDISSYISTNRKLSGSSKIALNDYVSSVKLTVNTYTAAGDKSEVFSGYLDAGKHYLEFSEPCSDLSTNIGQIIRSNYNWCEIDITQAGNCVIKGTKYEAAEYSSALRDDVLPAGEKENVKAFKSSLLQANGRELLKALKNFYSLKKSTDMKIFLEDEKVGDWIGILDVSGNIAYGFIESQSIDLTGGFISTIHSAGYETVSYASYFAGADLYAGGNFII